MKAEFRYEELRGAASSMFEYIKRGNWRVVAEKAEKVARIARQMEKKDADTDRR